MKTTVWNAGLLFKPTGDGYDIDVPFSKLPEKAPPVEIATEFVSELISRRIVDHDFKRSALDQITISGSQAIVEKAQKLWKRNDHIALGLKVNDEEILLLYPGKSHLSNLEATLGNIDLLNELNAYAHGIIESLTRQAKQKALLHSAAILEAIDRTLPIEDNYLNSVLEELRNEVTRLHEKIATDNCSKSEIDDFLKTISKGFVSGIASAAGKRVYEMIEPHLVSLVKALLILSGII